MQNTWLSEKHVFLYCCSQDFIASIFRLPWQHCGFRIYFVFHLRKANKVPQIVRFHSGNEGGLNTRIEPDPGLAPNSSHPLHDDGNHIPSCAFEEEEGGD